MVLELFKNSSDWCGTRAESFRDGKCFINQYDLHPHLLSSKAQNASLRTPTSPYFCTPPQNGTHPLPSARHLLSSPPPHMLQLTCPLVSKESDIDLERGSEVWSSVTVVGAELFASQVFRYLLSPLLAEHILFFYFFRNISSALHDSTDDLIIYRHIFD